MFWFGSQENSITSFLAQTFFFFFERERLDQKKKKKTKQSNKSVILEGKKKTILFVNEICLVLSHHWTRKH